MFTKALNAKNARKLVLAVLSILVFQQGKAQLSIKDTTIHWQTWDYSLNDDNSLIESNDTKIDKYFNAKVIENKFIKVVLLPEYGGRILSYIYKPTGHEQLYQNPVGGPYGHNEGNFYYDWLMVYGGIFPTFPEPEHGKMWLLPWSFKLVENSNQKIVIEMSIKDTIDFQSCPGKFSKGKTEITCVATITIKSNSSVVNMGIQLINNKNTSVNYEYWTCTTLTPGSVPGESYSPGNSEIVVPISQVQFDGWCSGWMSQKESPVNASDLVYKYKNLAFFENWDDMGIAYAYPGLTEDYWGVINHENEEGIFRISDHNKTPGLKFWTWGYDQSVNADPNDFNNEKRPYIELWGGVSHKFFENAVLNANETKSWVEHYYPTVKLAKITAMNENAASYLSYADNNGVLDLKADISTAFPESGFKAKFSLVGNSTVQVGSTSFISKTDTNKLQIDTRNLSLLPGNYTYKLDILDQSNSTILTAQIPVIVTTVSGIAYNQDNEQQMFIKYLNNSGYFSVNLPGNTAKALVQVFDINGVQVKNFFMYGEEESLSLVKKGMYIVKVSSNDNIYTQKIRVL